MADTVRESVLFAVKYTVSSVESVMLSALQQVSHHYTAEKQNCVKRIRFAFKIKRNDTDKHNYDSRYKVSCAS